MQYDSLDCQSPNYEVGVYECEVHLKFRLIEEKGVMSDRDQLLDTLLDAFNNGSDEYLEPFEILVDAQEIPEGNASALMRRRLIRLRNCRDRVT